MVALMDEDKCDEKLRENLVVDSGCCHVHDSICGGQTELQKDRQELPDEQPQGMQLREKLRLR